MSKLTGPLFKWFGSKWSSAPKYPKPAFSKIFEPYAGSAGYALRYASKDVTIYDNNNNINALWRWLIHKAEYKDVIAIPLNLAEGTDILSLDLSWGQKLLLKHWQRTNNYGNCWTISSWGNKPGQWTKNTRERVARELQYIKHWKIEPISFLESGTYFVDPPYEYNYRYGANDFDFNDMVMRINTIPNSNQVIVCEAVCPKTGQVPNYLPFKFFGNRVTSRRKEGDNVYSKELIYHRLTRTIYGEIYVTE